MTECEFMLAGWFEIYALPLPINMPPFEKVSMYGVTREGKKQNKKTKKKRKKEKNSKV